MAKDKSSSSVSSRRLFSSSVCVCTIAPSTTRIKFTYAFFSSLIILNTSTLPIAGFTTVDLPRNFSTISSLCFTTCAFSNSNFTAKSFICVSRCSKTERIFPLIMCFTCCRFSLYSVSLCNASQGPRQLPIWYSKQTLNFFALMLSSAKLRLQVLIGYNLRAKSSTACIIFTFAYGPKYVEPSFTGLRMA